MEDVESSEIDVQREIDELTPTGAELALLARELECDFECERTGRCKDRAACQASLVRVVKEIIRILYSYEKFITHMVMGISKMQHEIAEYLRERDFPSQPPPGDTMYG